MPAPTRGLPAAPNLEHLRKQAKDLLRDHRAGRAQALRLLRTHLPRLGGAPVADIRTTDLALTEAQLVVAREYGFSSWPDMLKSMGPPLDAVRAFKAAIEAGDTDAMQRMLQQHAELLEHPFEWTDPEGKVRRITALRYAFACDQKASFRVLVEAGSKPRFLESALWSNAYNQKLDRVREVLTWGVQPDDAMTVALRHCGTARRELIEILMEAGARVDDGPVLDLHRGRLASLKQHLIADPTLVNQQFPDVCHGLPTTGTLMHIAAAHNETDAIDLLVEHGADVDAVGPLHDVEDSRRFEVRFVGTGRQTPIFHTIGRAYGCCYDAFERLLAHGADLSVRALCLVHGEIAEVTPLGYALTSWNRGPSYGQSNVTLHETREHEIERLRALGAPEN